MAACGQHKGVQLRASPLLADFARNEKVRAKLELEVEQGTTVTNLRSASHLQALENASGGRFGTQRKRDGYFADCAKRQICVSWGLDESGTDPNPPIGMSFC